MVLVVVLAGYSSYTTVPGYHDTAITSTPENDNTQTQTLRRTDGHDSMILVQGAVSSGARALSSSHLMCTLQWHSGTLGHRTVTVVTSGGECSTTVPGLADPPTVGYSGHTGHRWGRKGLRGANINW